MTKLHDKKCDIFIAVSKILYNKKLSESTKLKLITRLLPEHLESINKKIISAASKGVYGKELDVYINDTLKAGLRSWINDLSHACKEYIIEKNAKITQKKITRESQRKNSSDVIVLKSRRMSRRSSRSKNSNKSKNTSRSKSSRSKSTSRSITPRGSSNSSGKKSFGRNDISINDLLSGKYSL